MLFHLPNLLCNVCHFKVHDTFQIVIQVAAKMLNPAVVQLALTVLRAYDCSERTACGFRGGSGVVDGSLCWLIFSMLLFSFLERKLLDWDCGRLLLTNMDVICFWELNTKAITFYNNFLYLLHSLSGMLLQALINPIDSLAAAKKVRFFLPPRLLFHRHPCPWWDLGLGSGGCPGCRATSRPDGGRKGRTGVS